MKAHHVALAAFACLLLATIPAGAEEILLRNGTSGVADVLETTVAMVEAGAVLSWQLVPPESVGTKRKNLWTSRDPACIRPYSCI